MTIVRKEIQQQLVSTSHRYNVSNEISNSIAAIKEEFKTFQQCVQEELKKELDASISVAIQKTTTQLTSMITNEVNKDLQSQLNALSPRNQKPKQSRAPNIMEPISQRLFSSTSDEHYWTHELSQSNNSESDYDIANDLFEANMTIRPDSPLLQDSDKEDNSIHQA